MKVIAHYMGFYGGERRRPGDVFEVPEGTTSKWFAPPGEKLEGYRAPVLPGPATGPKAPAGEPAAKSIDDMAAGELIAFAKAKNIDLGGMVAQTGKKNILPVIKAALEAKAPAGEPAEDRVSDQPVI